ncbi:tetratricopeptide repeat protein, partial [Actinoplanes subglobosus]
GRRDEALEPSQEAVTIYQLLAEANPGAYLPDLAMSLNNLGIRLSELGRRDEALEPSQEAVTIYQLLAEANPGAYLPNLAASLNNLGIRHSELGRRDEALEPSQEAVAIYRRLAEANPGAYLPDLAMSLNNLGIRLSELGRREEAVAVFQAAGEELDAGPRAELDVALARWRAREAGLVGDVTRDLIRAASRADDEEHPQRGARARRAVRTAVMELEPDDPPAGWPGWIAEPLPDETVALLNRVLAQTSWVERAVVLRLPEAQSVFGPSARPVRAALAPLYSDNPAIVHVLEVLDAAEEQGLDTVLDALQADEKHQTLVYGWLETPTWTASRRYLRSHPGLLTDPRTVEILAAIAADPVVQQHLAIARLSASMPIDTVYDIVLDAPDAVEAALAAIERADLDQLAEIWFAAPSLSRSPFVGPYVAAVLTARQVGGDDQARELVRMAAEQGDQETRRAAAARLSALAERVPDITELLLDLAGLLTTPDADTPPATTEPVSSP